MDSPYNNQTWRNLRIKILAQDKYECQICRANKRYAPAVIVHHVNHADARPDLFLSQFYADADGTLQRNLVSLCRDCHEREHNNLGKLRPAPLTPERW